MGWDVRDDGLAVVFSRDIPTLIRQQMREATATFLAREGLGFEDVDCFVCHPGGAKVIDALEEIYGLAPGGLVHSRRILPHTKELWQHVGGDDPVRARGRHRLKRRAALSPGEPRAWLHGRVHDDRGSVSIAVVIVLLVVLQRLAELVHARRNTARLRAEGGIEHGARHYPLIVLLHGSWLAAIAVFADPAAPLNHLLLGAFVLLQGARLWVIASLGRHWTTRIMTVPGAPLVLRGPYRYLRHPNYLIVAAEIALLPLVFGEWAIAVVFSAFKFALLRHRIRVENAALMESTAFSSP